MKFQSFRSAIVFASVIIGSIIPSQAFAQTQIYVLTGGSATVTSYATTSTYKFTGSMILNSIGFYTNGLTPSSLSYTLKGTTHTVTDFSVPNLSAEENGFRWLTISPQSMVNNEYVTVSTTGPTIDASSFPDPPMYVTQTAIFDTFTVNASATVSYVGLETGGNNLSDANYSNSNLRVSALGASVAPEPGSLALALTGGCALVGMVIRRRRMSN